MLSGQMSNQDEDEVEDELEALEAEMSGNKVNMPNAPNVIVGSLPEAPTETPKERARRRARERQQEGMEGGPEPIAA